MTPDDLAPRDRCQRGALDSKCAISYFFSIFFSGSAFTTGSSIVQGETLPSFHAAKEKVTFALPRPAPSGTRTGP